MVIFQPFNTERETIKFFFGVSAMAKAERYWNLDSWYATDDTCGSW